MIAEFKGDFIQRLRGFYCLAKSEDLSQAMLEMNRTQSALAYQIRSLEKEFNAKLFKVDGGRRHLTDKGKVLLEKTQRIFEILAKVKKDITKLPEIASGEIRIISIYTALQCFLAEKTKPFSEMFPNVTFRILAEACINPMLDTVRKGVCDIAILSVEDIPKDLKQIPLFETEVSLISPKTGPYAVSCETNLEHIAKLPCIYTMGNTTIQIFLEEEFGKYGLKMNKAHMISHYEGAKAYVGEGYGVTFLDSFACSAEDYKNYNIISMYPHFPKRTMSAVIRSNRFVPSYLEAFLNFICVEDATEKTIHARS